MLSGLSCFLASLNCHVAAKIGEVKDLSIKPLLVRLPFKINFKDACPSGVNIRMGKVRWYSSVGSSPLKGLGWGGPFPHRTPVNVGSRAVRGGVG